MPVVFVVAVKVGLYARAMSGRSLERLCVGTHRERRRHRRSPLIDISVMHVELYQSDCQLSTMKQLDTKQKPKRRSHERVLTFILVLSSLVALPAVAAEVQKLTDETYASLTEGKNIFVRLYAEG